MQVFAINPLTKEIHAVEIADTKKRPFKSSLALARSIQMKLMITVIDSSLMKNASSGNRAMWAALR